MTGIARDRVTIDLRGIGARVRAAAQQRCLPIASFARLALAEASAPVGGLVAAVASLPHDDSGTTIKLTLRLDAACAELLVSNSATLGLSYGSYVGRLVRGVPLPAPAAERVADRAALMRSCDQLAQLSADLAALIQMLRTANRQGAEQYRASAMSLATEVRRHLAIASQLMAREGENR